MSRNHFLKLIVRVLKEGKGAYLKVGQCGKYYNVQLQYGEKSEMITDEEYTLNEVYAHYKMIKYKKLLDGSKG